ncbi:MAG TPA: single-stranded DNA-binding protein, partial [Polyangiaceae bacterium]|nr:single-stranded DNA-binding protein [Polyangiaceae bacterium]
KNGEKRYSTEVVANNVVLPGSGRGRSEGEGPRERDGGARETGARAGGSARPSREAADAPFDDFAEPSGGSPGGGDDDIPF